MSVDLFSDEEVLQLSSNPPVACNDNLQSTFNPQAFDVGGGPTVPAPTSVPDVTSENAQAIIEQQVSGIPTDQESGSQNGLSRQKKKRPKNSRTRRIGRTSKRKQKKETQKMCDEADRTSPTESTVIEAVKRKYKKRKHQVSMSKRRKKSRQRIEEVFAKTNFEDTETSATVPNEQDTTDTSKRAYRKRKNNFSMPKKSKRMKLIPAPLDSDNVLNVSMAIIEGGDGDDHLEYEYLHKQNSNEISSSPASLVKENFETEELALQALENEISQLLSHSNSPWNVNTKSNVCRLTLMTPEPNAAVERTIAWGFSGMEIFIRNKPLSKSHFLMDLEMPDSSNLSNVAQFLVQHAAVVESANICSGVISHLNYWALAEKGVCYVEPDIYGEESCFRSTTCPLIYMNGKRCHKCEKIRDRLKCRKRRIANARGKDSSKINNRFLPKTSLLSKTSDLAKEKRKLNAQIKRLRKKIRKLIQQDTVALDSASSADLFKIFKANLHKMSDLQKMFWSEQLKAISRQRNPRSIRWSPMMIKIALHIQMQSPATYEYMRESGILKLPCERRLFDFTHFTEAKDGIQDEILKLLKPKLDLLTKENYDNFYNLLFDEMTIHQNLVLTKSGQMVGFTSPTDVEKSVADLEAQLLSEEVKRDKAKKVLVFMLQGISNQIHEVVALYPTTELNSQQLYVRAWDVIYSLESQDIKILSLIFDGASCNKKFITMHTKLDKTKDFTYVTKNIAAPDDRPLFFIVDPPHLIKTIRNCFSNSYGHKFTRQMVKNGEKISWEAVEMLHSHSVTSKYKTHKLTQAHVRLTPFSRMTVALATQTMSKSVARALSDFKDDPQFNGLVNSELISFILKVNTLFDCLNGSGDPEGKRNKTNDHLKSYTSLEDERLTRILKEDVLKFFQDWHQDAFQQQGLPTETMEKMTISDQSYQSLHITVYGFCGAVEFLLREGMPAVDAKMFNQDKLEQYFGLMRMSGGASNNPSYKVMRDKIQALYAQKSAALPKKKGNTMGKRRELEVNQEALPCRPRKKKGQFIVTSL